MHWGETKPKAEPLGPIRAWGLSETSYNKVFDVLELGRRALDLAHQAGVSTAYGTDLLGPMHRFQSREFTLRAEGQPPAAILRGATVIAARLLCLEGKIGVIAPNTWADLLVVDGNPLEDIGVLADPERHIRLIMKAGRTRGQGTGGDWPRCKR
jgi:imidazolonepropionase-like amidohydrolase